MGKSAQFTKRGEICGLMKKKEKRLATVKVGTFHKKSAD